MNLKDVFEDVDGDKHCVPIWARLEYGDRGECSEPVSGSRRGLHQVGQPGEPERRGWSGGAGKWRAQGRCFRSVEGERGIGAGALGRDKRNGSTNLDHIKRSKPGHAKRFKDRDVLGRIEEAGGERATRRFLRFRFRAHGCVSIRSLFESRGQKFRLCHSHALQDRDEDRRQNESAKDLQLLFYDVDYTIGDKHGKEDLYFHAHYFRQDPTELRHDFEVLPETEGKGRFLGASFGVRANLKRYGHNWWGEGEVKIYVDGDQALPTLAGTGTEDYVGSGWGLGQFSHLYQGAAYIDERDGVYSFYRFHVPDPIYFQSGIKVTIQQIGFVLDDSDVLFKSGTPVYRTGPHLGEMKRGERGMFERQDDWAAVAYFYLDRAEDKLPEIESPERRAKGMSQNGPLFGQTQ